MFVFVALEFDCGHSRDWSADTVAGVHVDADATAMQIESAAASDPFIL
jgi:hypothetical protein